jgi:hypothetical protein
MTTVDSTHFLANGGYLQKGREKNLTAMDLGQKTHDLVPSRYYRDEKIFQLEKRALFSTVSIVILLGSEQPRAAQQVLRLATDEFVL